MFKIGNRVIRITAEQAADVGIVTGVVLDDRHSDEYSLFDVEFRSGPKTLHGTQLKPAPPRDLSCEQRDLLARIFQKAFEFQNKAVSALANAAGTIPRAEFEFLNQRAQIAKEVAAFARERLIKHTFEHGC